MKMGSYKSKKWLKEMNNVEEKINEHSVKVLDFLIDECIRLNQRLIDLCQYITNETSLRNIKTKQELDEFYDSLEPDFELSFIYEHNNTFHEKLVEKNFKPFQNYMTECLKLINLRYGKEMTKRDKEKLINRASKFMDSLFYKFMDSVTDIHNLYLLDRKQFLSVVERLEEIEKNDISISTSNLKELDNNSNDINKIFNYKDMINKALDKGFEETRRKGSHIIFKHKITNKILVIPAHDLKYGLMCEIQKQIKENSK